MEERAPLWMENRFVIVLRQNTLADSATKVKRFIFDSLHFPNAILTPYCVCNVKSFLKRLFAPI